MEGWSERQMKRYIYAWLLLFFLSLPALPRLIYGSMHPEAVLLFYLAFVTVGSAIIVALYKASE